MKIVTVTLQSATKEDIKAVRAYFRAICKDFRVTTYRAGGLAYASVGIYDDDGISNKGAAFVEATNWLIENGWVCYTTGNANHWLTMQAAAVEHNAFYHIGIIGKLCAE